LSENFKTTAWDTMEIAGTDEKRLAPEAGVMEQLI